MFVKLMSADDLPDHHYAKGFQLIETLHARFIRGETGPQVEYSIQDGVWNNRTLEGNAYILNSEGKTIETFAKDSTRNK